MPKLCYAAPYKERAAYDWTVELSIYLSQDARHQGYGQQLYQALEEALLAAGIVNILSCISLPNEASIAFHKRNGFEQVAHFKAVGYKFDKWHDIIWMQKKLLQNKPTIN